MHDAASEVDRETDTAAPGAGSSRPRAPQAADGSEPSPPGYGPLRRLYARYARDYDRRFERYSAATLERAVAALGDEPPERLVDVACGTGLLAARVRQRWPATAIVGVDLSPDMLAQAARRLPRSDGSHAPATDWRVGPAEALPVETASADTLTCTNAFHLVQRPEAALAEFHRALAPGGRLVLVDWTRDFLSMRLLLLALPLLRRQRRRAWTLEALSHAVGGAGFEIEATDRFKVGPVWGLMTVVARRSRGPAGR